MKTISIFTDGASRGNPGPGGWGAVIAFGDDTTNARRTHDEHTPNGAKVVELGGAERNTTNNRMELTAAIEALNFLFSYGLRTTDYRLIIYTDSQYLINGITKWIFSWEKRNWITKNKEPVLNRDLWEKLLEVSKLKKVEWKYVGGHSGIAGNERADQIATEFADRKNPELYSGPFSQYKTKVLELSDQDLTYDISYVEQSRSKKSKTKTRAKIYSYVSLVDKVIKTHKTWAECEKRVKGKSGARFKKVFSKDEESELVKKWKNL